MALYARSRSYSHAMRLAKTHGMDSELLSFAMQSRPALMIEAAQYFEASLRLSRAPIDVQHSDFSSSVLLSDRNH